jgi:hypothetical protein
MSRTAAKHVDVCPRHIVIPTPVRWTTCELLETLDPKARDDLRRVLIRDQADRDAISSHLMIS